MSPNLQSELVLRSPAVADGDLYRLLTSAFMHYGITHLLFNMYALYVVGPPLEVWLGRLRFSALYALSALGGSVLVYLALTAQRVRPRVRRVRCSVSSARGSWWASGSTSTSDGWSGSS